MQAKPQTNDYTIEDYLSFEETALEKSEYCNGTIFQMPASSLNHNQLSGNISVALHLTLKQKNYRVYISDIKIWIPQRRSFNYPDVLVIAGAPQFYAQRKDVLLNPLMIVEVLSDSTQDYDRGDKFAQYRTLTSLQEYILVSQSAFHIEYFSKVAPNEWLFTEIDRNRRRKCQFSIKVFKS
jgi:Uma2 family endonuclease